MARESGVKQVADNRKARHEYFLDETVEAGMVLLGSEVKSLREGRVNLKDGYARISRHGQIDLVNVHISPWTHTHSDVPDPVRTRRLLLHRREIDRLGGKTRERGITLIPTRIYFKNGKAKVEIALARGKEKQDKRQDERTSEAKRDIERAMKSSRR
jgi:SsrA-binding protein